MLIRSEKHDVKATHQDRIRLGDTVDEYRRLVRALCGIFFVHFAELSRASSKCFAAERLIHRTADNLNPRYPMIDRMFPKFPSYYRRAAIEAAFGVVSSFLSNYDNWVTGQRKTKNSEPPKLGLSSVFPPLYGGQCIRIGEDWKSVSIKVFSKPSGVAGDAQKTKAAWTWTAPMSVLGRLKRVGNDRDLSPTLVANQSRASLSCPVKLKHPKSLNIAKADRKAISSKIGAQQTKRQKNKLENDAKCGGKAAALPPFSINDLFAVFNRKPVCSIDVGINTTATGAIVAPDGTVIARRFFASGRHNDQRDKLGTQIRNKAAATSLKNSAQRKGFCSNLYARVAGISKQSAREISKQIIDFASEHGAATLVFEHLKGWRPKAPKKTMRSRFHRFLHRAIVRCAQYKAEEIGMRVAFVPPRGTSAWAHDGSGKVSRDSKNYSLCTFASGKRYNADLNAAYNIAARFIVRALGDVGFNPGDGPAADTGKSSRSAPRMPVCLSHVWAFAAALKPAQLQAAA